jgi:hypothetical protein
MIAEASEPIQHLMPFVNLGAIGMVLGWFLWKAEPRMRAVEAAIDRQTQAILILLLELERTTPAAKERAEEILKRIEAAKVEREGK